MRDLRLDAIPRARIDREALSRFLNHSAPLDLEIGCGVGWHPIRRSALHPERRLVAIERTLAKFRAFEGRLARHPHVTNLHAIHADATSVLAHDLPLAQFENVFLLYPNPEPSNPAQRWIRRPFFRRILEILKPDGRILFATNELGYFEELQRFGPEAWSLTIESQRTLGAADFPRARTHFEKKYLARGENCFEIVFRK